MFAEKLSLTRELWSYPDLETAAKNVKELKIGRHDLDGVFVKQEVNKVSHQKRKSKPPTATITCIVWDPWSSCNTVEAMPPVQEKGHLRKVYRRGKQQGSDLKIMPLSQQVCQVEEEVDENPPMLNFVSQHNCVLPL